MSDFWIYLAILAGSTYLIRAIPFAAISKKIENKFIKSFLFYVPYAVIAAMTLPAALFATGNVLSAVVGLLAGAIFAYIGKSLTVVAAASCIAALVTEMILKLFS